MAEPVSSSSPEQFWEDLYRKRDQVWSGEPNFLLVREVTGLPAGTVLDLGCGEGGDAIWLAERGWNVTAVDISATALARGAAQASAEGVTDQITWLQRDLSVSFPQGTFDLVSASYLHSPVELPRGTILLAAASAVKPGGTLLIAGHAGWPSWRQPNWEHDHDPDVHFPTPDEVLESLELRPGEWQVQRKETLHRPAIRPDGEPGTRPDNVIKVVRLATGGVTSSAP